MLILALACAAALPLAHTGCSTPPAARTQAATSLKITGLTAKAAIDAAALLLREGQITRGQWDRIAAFYDLRFQPAFNLAVATARADLSGPASPDLAALLTEFTALIAAQKEAKP